MVGRGQADWTEPMLMICRDGVRPFRGLRRGPTRGAEHLWNPVPACPRLLPFGFQDRLNSRSIGPQRAACKFQCGA
jgi:hypothetical protein